MKVRGLGQLSLNKLFNPTRSPNAKLGEQSFFASALVTENDLKRAGQHSPDITATSVHRDSDTTESIILRYEDQWQVHHEGVSQPETKGFLKSRAEESKEQIH